MHTIGHFFRFTIILDQTSMSTGNRRQSKSQCSSPDGDTPDFRLVLPCTAEAHSPPFLPCFCVGLRFNFGANDVIVSFVSNHDYPKDLVICANTIDYRMVLFRLRR